MPRLGETPLIDPTAEIVASTLGRYTEVAARTHAHQHGATYVSPYNDPAVIAGQGTIGRELELDLQAKLLKVIEDRRVRRVGGERELEVDAQIVAATNQDLETRVAKGEFRRDLYHRLAVFRLDVPPLRQRKQDLDDLLPVFIDEFNARSGQRVDSVPDAVWQRLAAYDWPGNVRELRNLVERCVLLADGPVFPQRWLHLEDSDTTHASTTVARCDDGDRVCLPLDGSVSFDAMERRILIEALRRNGDNVSQTARVLGTTREKLRYRVQKYGLKTSD